MTAATRDRDARPSPGDWPSNACDAAFRFFRRVRPRVLICLGVILAIHLAFVARTFQLNRSLARVERDIAQARFEAFQAKRGLYAQLDPARLGVGPPEGVIMPATSEPEAIATPPLPELEPSPLGTLAGINAPEAPYTLAGDLGGH